MMKGKARRTKNDTFIAYAMLFPALLIFLCFVGGPIVTTVFGLSMTKYNLLSPPQFVFLDNFIQFFKDPMSGTIFFNTFKYVIFLVPAHMILGLLLALLVNSEKNRFLRGFHRTMIYFPSLVTTSAVAVAFAYLFRTDFGVINYILKSLGIIQQNIPWLTSSGLSIPVILIFSLWKTVGDKFLFYLIGLQNIPTSYMEAARIDGANAWQTFRSVTLPMLTPTIFFVMLTTTIGAVQIFDEPFIITKGGPGDSSRTIALYLYQKAFVSNDVGYASAIACMLFLIILLITIIQLRTEKYWTNYDYE